MNTALRPQTRRAFSLVEMMVAVGLLSVVILALFAMFNQTQKALRANVSQVDTSEAARAAFESITRDLEDLQVANIPHGPNFVTRMSARRSITLNGSRLFTDRNFVLQEFYGLKRAANSATTLLETNEHVYVVGWFVARADNPTLGADYGANSRNSNRRVGTLYRYEDRDPVNLRGRGAASNLVERMLARPFELRPGPGWNYRTNSSRVLDGVIGLKIVTYDAKMRPLDWSWFVNPPVYPESERPPDVPQVVSYDLPPISFGSVANDSFATYANFAYNALPTAVDVELAVLEPRALKQFRTLPNDALREKFLADHLGSVQVFRQRIPIRTALR